MGVWFSVSVQADGRRHVNDSFEQFGCFQIRRRVIATLKLVARQLIARFQGRNRRQPMWNFGSNNVRSSYRFDFGRFRHVHSPIAFVVESARPPIVADAGEEYKQAGPSL
jgi:hypothetical protein